MAKYESYIVQDADGKTREYSVAEFLKLYTDTVNSLDVAKKRVAELEARLAWQEWRQPNDWPHNGQEIEVIFKAIFNEPDENLWAHESVWDVDYSEWNKADGYAVRGWRPLPQP